MESELEAKSYLLHHMNFLRITHIPPPLSPITVARFIADLRIPERLRWIRQPPSVAADSPPPQSDVVALSTYFTARLKYQDVVARIKAVIQHSTVPRILFGQTPYMVLTEADVLFETYLTQQYAQLRNTVSIREVDELFPEANLELSILRWIEQELTPKVDVTEENRRRNHYNQYWIAVAHIWIQAAARLNWLAEHMPGAKESVADYIVYPYNRWMVWLEPSSRLAQWFCKEFNR